MITIHWLGAGLSSRPGFERLKSLPRSRLILWSRNQAKAESWLGACSEFRQFDMAELESSLAPGDCVVSMLPASMHPQVAKACLAKRAHLVTSSYLSAEMSMLHTEAARLGLTFLNEVGLDPGIDHMFAHALVADLKEKRPAESALEIAFISVCGGFPAELDDFKYRFSWSPLGVLKALRQESVWIEDGRRNTAAFPADAVRNHLFGRERLEMYPNRNSLPYVAEYRMEELGSVETFIRGTLRPDGWSTAWSRILPKLGAMSDDELTSLAGELAGQYSYRPFERDRVCLEVRLSAKDTLSDWKYERSFFLNEVGDGRGGAAMARTVSLTTAIGVEAILSGELSAGVWGCLSDAKWVRYWLDALAGAGIGIGSTGLA